MAGNCTCIEHKDVENRQGVVLPFEDGQKAENFTL